MRDMDRTWLQELDEEIHGYHRRDLYPDNDYSRIITEHEYARPLKTGEVERIVNTVHRDPNLLFYKVTEVSPFRRAYEVTQMLQPTPEMLPQVQPLLRFPKEDVPDTSLASIEDLLEDRSIRDRFEKLAADPVVVKYEKATWR